MYLSSNGLKKSPKDDFIKSLYATGLRTERKHLPSFVSSLVKHMHGRGIASSRREIVLNLHFLRWSAMLAMLANFHSFTVPKAVLNRHTLSVICHDGDPSARRFFSHSRTTMPRIWSKLAHTSLMVRDTLDSWHKLKLSRKLATCCNTSKGRLLN